MFAPSNRAPFYQRGSEVRRPNGEIAFTLGKYQLSGAPNSAENAGGPTDLLDNFAQQRIFGLLTWPYTPAGQEKPPSLPSDKRQSPVAREDDGIRARPIHVSHIGDAKAELRN
jgi:hypothetical protein